MWIVFIVLLPSQIHNANIKIVYFMCNYFEHFF